MVSFYVLSKYDKVSFVFQYLMAIEAFIGIIANTLAFVVFNRPRMQKYSFAFYNKIRVFTDNIVLLHSFRHWAAFVFDANIDVTSNVVCKLIEYSVYVSGSISMWLLALTALDRLLTIVFPSRFDILKKRSTQTVLVVCVIIYCVGLFMPMPISYNLMEDVTPVNGTNLTNTVKSCTILDPSNAKIIYWISVINTFAVTFVINNCLVVVIIVFIFMSRNKFKAASMENNKENKRASKDRKFAVNSIVLNLKCFLCKLPILVLLLISTYLNIPPDAVGMLFNIGVFIYTLDNTCPFFVNIMVNSIFYEEFIRYFSFNINTNANANTKSKNNNSNSTASTNAKSTKIKSEAE